MKQPMVMDGELFRDSLIIIGITLVGSLFFAFLFIGLWHWRTKIKLQMEGIK